MSYLGHGFESNRTVYREFNANQEDGGIAGGFLIKNRELELDRTHCFLNYGGLLVLKGQGAYISADGHYMPVGPGDFIQRMPNIPHRTPILADEPWEEVFVCIGRALYEDLCALGVLINDRPVLHPGLNAGLIKAFMRLLNLLEQNDHADARQLQEAINILLEVVRLDFIFSNANIHSIKLAPLLDEAIEQHAYAKDSVLAAACKAGISYEDFRKQFRKETRTSPGRFVIERRIQKARRMLESGSTPVEEIAFTLGYPDAATFSHQFRRFTGSSPSCYRRSLYGIQS